MGSQFWWLRDETPKELVDFVHVKKHESDVTLSHLSALLSHCKDQRCNPSGITQPSNEMTPSGETEVTILFTYCWDSPSETAQKVDLGSRPWAYGDKITSDRSWGQLTHANRGPSRWRRA